MAKQVPWCKVILEEFISLASLTKDEEKIIRTRVAGWTIRQQASEFGMSERTVDDIIKILKLKYDQVQKFSPILPPRKQSAKELYMDTH